MSKDVFRKVFWPILYFFEKDGQQASAEGYRPSHRKILFAVGFLFFVLAMATLFFALIYGSLGALFPIIVFFVISLVCAVVATLGSDGAVARIWGSQHFDE